MIMVLVPIVMKCAGAFWLCQAQQATGVDYRLIYALCQVESKVNHAAYTPHDGNSPSLGACQVKMDTARMLGFKGSESELMKPVVNGTYAAKYILHQYYRYGSMDKAISAYNAGRAITSNASYVHAVLNSYFNLVNGGPNETR